MPKADIPLSICVPIYNRQFMIVRNVAFHFEAFLRPEIPFEIVIVDDCATDCIDDDIRPLSGELEVSASRRIKNSGFIIAPGQKTG